MTALAVTALLSFAAVGPVQAALQAVGPQDPVYAIPKWIQDTQGLSLQICVDQTPLPSGNIPCVLTPQFDPAITTPPDPITATGPVSATNFPDESFYWIADSAPMTVGPTGGDTISLRMALEVAYLGVVAPGNATVFLRVNVNKVSGLTPGNYTVTHPFGSFTFTADGNGDSPKPQLFRSEDFCIANCNTATIPSAADALIAAAETGMGPFLIWDPNEAPAAPAGFIGDPGIVHGLINPATLATAVVRIDGPNVGGIGVNTVQTTRFTVAGKKIGLSTARTPASGPVTTLAGTPIDIPVTVTNVTGVGVAFGAAPFAIAGPHANDFSIVAGDNCRNNTIAAAGTCTFNIRYSPAVGTILPLHEATVTLTATDPLVAPPVTIPVSGIPQYRITPIVSANGAVTMKVGTGTAATASVQDITAGSSVEFTVTPTNTPTATYLTRVLDGAARVVPNAAGKFTLNNLADHHTVDVKFLRAGKLTAGGTDTLVAGDALRALQIALGVGVVASADELTAGDVGPLVAGKPKADGSIDVSDVMLILRRAVGVDPVW